MWLPSYPVEDTVTSVETVEAVRTDETVEADEAVEAVRKAEEVGAVCTDELQRLKAVAMVEQRGVLW